MAVVALVAMIISVLPKPDNVKEFRRPAEKQNATFKQEGNLYIVKAETGDTIKALDIEIADNEYEITQGLMFRKSMKENRGMLFIQPQEQVQNFWMKNTHISLDIIFINSNFEIVSAQEYATPYSEASLASTAPALYVLEVNAGSMQKWGVKAGDKIIFNRS